jgi:hypothetical protein
MDTNINYSTYVQTWQIRAGFKEGWLVSNLVFFIYIGGVLRVSLQNSRFLRMMNDFVGTRGFFRGRVHA